MASDHKGFANPLAEAHATRAAQGPAALRTAALRATSLRRGRAAGAHGSQRQQKTTDQTSPNELTGRLRPGLNRILSHREPPPPPTLERHL